MGWYFQILFTFVLCTVGFAAPADEARELFQKHYYEHYEERRCGQNVLSLAKALPAASGFYVVTIENKGFSVFGMVNAEAARGQSFRKPANVEANWYHHVILVDDRGFVYDMDYTIEPSVVSMEEYLEKMFLDEPECEKSGTGEFCGGRENKMKEYQLESTPADDVIHRRKVEPKRAKLGEVLEDWMVLR